MKLKIYQIDAFAEHVFSGNPAAVVPLEKWLPSDLMQKIAMENNLSETAFFVPAPNGFHIRWFTPSTEVDLCGHATLATAHVIFNHLGYPENNIRFESRSGTLNVKNQNGQIVLDFPASKVEDLEVHSVFKAVFQIQPIKCFRGRDDLMLLFDSEKDVQLLAPDFQMIAKIKARGIIATAKSEKYDFISRFFAPAVGVTEDPVTGSAHTMLIPFWAKQLDKTDLIARQISKRGGILYCKNLGMRVEIAGNAVTYMIGEIEI